MQPPKRKLRASMVKPNVGLHKECDKRGMGVGVTRPKVEAENRRRRDVVLQLTESLREKQGHERRYLRVSYFFVHLLDIVC